MTETVTMVISGHTPGIFNWDRKLYTHNIRTGDETGEKGLIKVTEPRYHIYTMW